MKGEVYSYKGKTYVVMDEGMMKNPSNGEWCESVNYIQVNWHATFTRLKADFLMKFKKEAQLETNTLAQIRAILDGSAPESYATPKPAAIAVTKNEPAYNLTQEPIWCFTTNLTGSMNFVVAEDETMANKIIRKQMPDEAAYGDFDGITPKQLTEEEILKATVILDGKKLNFAEARKLLGQQTGKTQFFLTSTIFEGGLELKPVDPADVIRDV